MREQTSPSFRVVQLMTFPWRGLHCLRVCVCPVCFRLCFVCSVCTEYSYQPVLLTVIFLVSQLGPGLKLLF